MPEPPRSSAPLVRRAAPWHVDRRRCPLDAELLQAVAAEASTRDGLGWVLGVDLERPDGLPATRALDRQLRHGLDDLVPDGAAFSFLKTSTNARPPDDHLHHGRFHVDTADGLGPGRELARLLVNLSPRPRRVRLACCSRDDVDRSGYAVHAVPEGTEVEVATIDGSDGTSVSALSFWPSIVPHVGIEDGPYFLVSYETVLPWPGEEGFPEPRRHCR